MAQVKSLRDLSAKQTPASKAATRVASAKSVVSSAKRIASNIGAADVYVNKVFTAFTKQKVKYTSAQLKKAVSNLEKTAKALKTNYAAAAVNLARAIRLGLPTTTIAGQMEDLSTLSNKIACLRITAKASLAEDEGTVNLDDQGNVDMSEAPDVTAEETDPALISPPRNQQMEADQGFDSEAPTLASGDNPPAGAAPQMQPEVPADKTAGDDMEDFSADDLNDMELTDPNIDEAIAADVLGDDAMPAAAADDDSDEPVASARASKNRAMATRKLASATSSKTAVQSPEAAMLKQLASELIAL